MAPQQIARDGLPMYDVPKSARPGLVVAGSARSTLHALRARLTSEMPSGQTFVGGEMSQHRLVLLPFATAHAPRLVAGLGEIHASPPIPQGVVETPPVLIGHF